ncbi:hypothetical protein CM19_01730 [Candidatus Acidianus copahuensis]|uniref:Glycosyltransferase 2-like domain-containing protein n=1 Tax=Candidatus Acidianus copahuensis TaxID=1160895 RepID=A0A031LTX2_9CREN|nr:hypothetical protein [Candidatus Acidianus copahuensis]EZQ11271.1 hypothetical protein CM19_01730 [Candidatus Acidianus copahuensis]
MKIYEALKTINGEIVAPLDDDDVFLQGKLRSIQEAFSNDIDFYRNEVVAIDSEGNEINSPFDRSEIRKIVRAGDHAIVDKREAYTKFKSNVDLLTFNNSSIAISTDLLKKHSEYLRKIERLTDAFFFYISLNSNKKIFIDLKKLTGYRIHGENSSIRYLNTFEDFLAYMRQFYMSRERDWENIKEAMETEWAKDYVTVFYLFTKCLRESIEGRHEDRMECIRVGLDRYVNGYIVPKKVLLLSLLPHSLQRSLWKRVWKNQVKSLNPSSLL